MAIFSQKNPKTLVDSRKIDLSAPNRSVPFKLPVDVKSKLSKVLRELKLNTGSIDMLVSTSNDYIFLEVNPIGQFGMVSRPCNYPIEQNISNLL
jgi:glutathione synthase/RimK-type ligase-like ATP-grasp enzyme